MPESINLIPHEEKQVQVTAQAVRLSTVVTIFLFVIVAAVSGFFYYRIYTLKNLSKSLDTKITSHRAEITTLAPIEITARNLDARYQSLSSIYSSRVYFSKLLKEVKDRTPSSVVIDAFTIIPGNKITVNGTSQSYISIAEFINKLAESNSVFTDVSLNSVNLEKSTNRVGFYIMVTYNPEVLK
jgi:Tfp pilus assembly protein PilN